MHIVLPVLAGLASVSSASATVASPTERAQSEDKVICKHSRQTGTRFTKKICKTALQWDRIADENRAAASEMVNRPQISTERGN